MPSIEIDQEVFELLQRNATPFVDTPNVALRRLLGFDEVEEAKAGSKPGVSALAAPPVRHKQVRATLSTLVASGLLREGERLHLVDYRGAPVPETDVIVSGNHIIWKGQAFSMSRLARRFFEKLGFKSTDVRGPKYWVNGEGVSVLALWERYLDGLEDAEDGAAFDARRGEPTVSLDDMAQDLRERGLL